MDIQEYALALKHENMSASLLFPTDDDKLKLREAFFLPIIIFEFCLLLTYRSEKSQSNDNHSPDDCVSDSNGVTKEAVICQIPKEQLSLPEVGSSAVVKSSEQSDAIRGTLSTSDSSISLDVYLPFMMASSGPETEVNKE
jgi:hypothetical protein